MPKFFLPITNAEDWKKLLAAPEKHWRDGYSAKALAYCWEEAKGFPLEIAKLLSGSGEPLFQDVELLLAFPEWQVSLPGGQRPSQNDLFVLARAGDELVTMMVEGKVLEPFGPTVEEWKLDASPGKIKRLEFLADQLGLPEVSHIPGSIRYQLLHRAVSAIIEARRFKANSAMMIVHSFSQNENDQWFDDFLAFLELFHLTAIPGQLVFICRTKGVNFYCGWARGNKKYLFNRKN